MSGSEQGPATPAGLGALGSQEFSVADAVGGWRGLIESTAPGLVFVVVYVITRDLTPTLIAALAVTAIAVVARLVRRSSVTYALGGVLGVGIGAIWAWRSGQAQDYFAWGLITNAGMLLGVVISILVRWPVVGLVAGALGLSRAREPVQEGQAGSGPVDSASTRVPGANPELSSAPQPILDTAWRGDPALVRRYVMASWLWAGAFALRLAVQLPLYLGQEVGWLGTARLVMGVPLWALVLWITWLLVRPRAGAATRPPGGSSR